MLTETIKYHCGCERKAEYPHLRFGKNDVKTINTTSLCYNCRLKLIGTRCNVIRYGDIPKNGKSYNYRDNKYEDGVSCYFDFMRTRPEFTDNRKKIEISAIVIGFGGDDEPLIDCKTVEANNTLTEED